MVSSYCPVVPRKRKARGGKGRRDRESFGPEDLSAVKERTPPAVNDEKEGSPGAAAKGEPPAEVVYVAAPPPLVNPWKKPEPVHVPAVAPATPVAEAVAEEKNAAAKPPPVKKAEKKAPLSATVGKVRKETAGAVEGGVVSKEAETTAEVEKKPEVRTLPPAPKTNPWKKSVLPKEKEEIDQPKVNVLKQT